MSVRKSISSAYFSMTAVVLVTSILAMGFLQMYLSMEYFKTDKENTLDDIVTLAAARASMEQGPLESWQESATGQQLQSTISLIGQSSGNVVFATDTAGRVLMCSEGENCRHKTAVSEKILEKIRTDGEYFELGDLGGAAPQRYYTSARAVYDEAGRAMVYVFASADAAGMGVFVSDMFSSFVLSAGLMLLVASVLSILLTSRLNAYDGFPRPYGFGAAEGGGLEPDLAEPIRLVQILRDELRLPLVNITIGNPYVNPHVNRPADWQPYPLPEDPLLGVARMLACVGGIKRAAPGVQIVGSALSYPRQFAGNLAAGAIGAGLMDAAGFGRLSFAYPEFARDLLSGAGLDRRRCCVACGKCSQLMRMGSRTGCVVRDPEFTNLYKELTKK